MIVCLVFGEMETAEEADGMTTELDPPDTTPFTSTFSLFPDDERAVGSHLRAVQLQDLCEQKSAAEKSS